MKTIRLRDDIAQKSRDVIRQVVTLADQRTGVNIDQMRRRMKVLDALDKANGELRLEDADWEVLKAVYETFPFGMVNKDVLTIADDIRDAKSE